MNEMRNRANPEIDARPVLSKEYLVFPVQTQSGNWQQSPDRALQTRHAIPSFSQTITQFEGLRKVTC